MIFQESMPLLILLICFSLTWQSWIKNSMTYFYPIYAEEQFYGIWSSDSLNQLKKQVSSHVTKECMFHYFPMLYNMNDTCVYYYDRNWDEISVVTSDSIQTLYSLGVKQRIPLFKKDKGHYSSGVGWVCHSS